MKTQPELDDQGNNARFYRTAVIKSNSSNHRHALAQSVHAPAVRRRPCTARWPAAAPSAARARPAPAASNRRWSPRQPPAPPTTRPSAPADAGKYLFSVPLSPPSVQDTDSDNACCAQRVQALAPCRRRTCRASMCSPAVMQKPTFTACVTLGPAVYLDSAAVGCAISACRY